MKYIFDKFIHKTLRVPYTLRVRSKHRVKNAHQTLVFLHGIGNSGESWRAVIKGLAHDPVNIVVVDLLGFGDSPRPLWAEYDCTLQARAVAQTLRRHRITGKVTIVGHSMGALVAIEYARRYKKRVAALVLCSPPLYSHTAKKYLPKRDAQLRKLYNYAASSPEALIQMGMLAKKYGFVGSAFELSQSTVDEYVAALRATIITQTSLDDIATLSLPITILYGTLDPFVVAGNVRKLAKNHTNITTKSFIGGHEIEGRYVPLTIKVVRELYK